jgi:hypothetical protein
MSRQSIAQRAAAAVRPPSHQDRRADRPPRSPQWDQAFGRRRRPPAADDIPRLRNGARIKQLIGLIQARRRADWHQWIKDGRKFLIAAARHCPESEAKEDWLPRWAAQYLPQCDPNIIGKVGAAVHRKPGRLSSDEIAELLKVTFAERQRLKLWSFNACDLSRAELKAKTKANKKRQDRERAAERRRQRGATARSQSLERLKPWKAQGISRKTWYKRRRQLRQRAGIVKLHRKPNGTAASAARHESRTLAQPTGSKLCLSDAGRAPSLAS